jgi:hypothetical protein
MMTPLSDKPASNLRLAPSMDPTPSPLKRITRSMSGSSPLLLSPLTNLTEGLLGSGGGMTPDDEARPGRGRRGTRPSHVRVAEQQNKWGFVPGEEDTLKLDMKQPGGGGRVLLLELDCITEGASAWCCNAVLTRMVQVFAIQLFKYTSRQLMTTTTINRIWR